MCNKCVTKTCSVLPEWISETASLTACRLRGGLAKQSGNSFAYRRTSTTTTASVNLSGNGVTRCPGGMLASYFTRLNCYFFFFFFFTHPHSLSRGRPPAGRAISVMIFPPTYPPEYYTFMPELNFTILLDF